MGTIVLILTWTCAIGIICTSSRMIWSFARDKATPFSHIVRRVSHGTQVPRAALDVVCLCGCLLTLIFIGSPTAFSDVISLTITGFYVSYFVPSAFLLYRRIRGDVRTRAECPPEVPFPDTTPQDGHLDTTPQDGHLDITPQDGHLDTTPQDGHLDTPQDGPHPVAAQAAFTWGPFHIPGTLGTLNNAYACIYMIFVIFWSVWPPSTPVTASTMNYSVVVTGGVIIFSIIWYFIHGRKVYKGPLVDDIIMKQMKRPSVGVVRDVSGAQTEGLSHPGTNSAVA
jgi:choline transport protein